MRKLACLLLFPLAAACSRSDDIPPPPPVEAPPATAATAVAVDPVKRDVDSAVESLEAMAQIWAKNQGDCDKLGDELQVYIDKNRAEMQRVKDRADVMTPEEKAEFQKQYPPRADPTMKKLRTLMQKCVDNPKVERALKSLPG